MSNIDRIGLDRIGFHDAITSYSPIDLEVSSPRTQPMDQGRIADITYIPTYMTLLSHYYPKPCLSQRRSHRIPLMRPPGFTSAAARSVISLTSFRFMIDLESPIEYINGRARVNRHLPSRQFGLFDNYLLHKVNVSTISSDSAAETRSSRRLCVRSRRLSPLSSLVSRCVIRSNANF